MSQPKRKVNFTAMESFELVPWHRPVQSADVGV